MFIVWFPRGSGWVLAWDADDKVIGPHWTQTQTYKNAARFKTHEEATKAVRQSTHNLLDCTILPMSQHDLNRLRV